MPPIFPQILCKSKAPCFLVSDLINIKYLTGMDVSFGIALITSRSIQLFVDSRYFEASKKGAIQGIRVQDISKLENVLKKISVCGFESEYVTIDVLRNWKRKNKNTKFVRRKGVIQHFRRQKSADELKKFRRSQKITREILRRVPAALRSLPTERGLAWRLETWARELKAEGLSFDPIVAFGTNSSRPHHHPTDRKLKRGQIVQIDVGTKYKGYCSDQSRVFFTGKATSLQKKVYMAVEEAQEKAAVLIESGVTNHKLDKVARKVLSEHGFEKNFTHSLGHGVGLEIHEGISLSQKAPRKKLLENEIITIEPGVYLPGRFGIRLEDEFIVCSN